MQLTKITAKKALMTTVKFVLMLVAFVGLLILNWNTWKKDYQQEQTIISLQEQLLIQQREHVDIKETNAKLRSRINSLKRGSIEMLEEEARDSFGMVKEGETFYDF